MVVDCSMLRLVARSADGSLASTGPAFSLSALNSQAIASGAIAILF
jgi:hypothetical protein